MMSRKLGAARQVSLPGGRSIIIRPVRGNDDAGLAALYDTLSDEDRHRRFFSNYHPRSTFFTDMATVQDRRGGRLVAVLTPPSSSMGRIVGEAGYTMLPNGNGEIGMAVEPDWRGWLGPYLFDALVDAAAVAGVPNLEADVLALNGPMLALLRKRGSVVMDHEDWSVVRLLIGTSGRTPTWPGPHDRPRVLVEGAGGRWRAEAAARAAGLQLLGCPGPLPGRPRCPVLDGESCPLASGADVIVVSPPPGDERWDGLLAGHAEVHPGVAVCLEASRRSVPDGVAVPMCPSGGAAEVVSFVRHLAGWSPDEAAAV